MMRNDRFKQGRIFTVEPFAQRFQSKILALTTATGINFDRRRFSDWTLSQKNFLRSIGVNDFGMVRTIRQVHGRRVAVFRQGSRCRGAEREADGVLTDIPGAVLTIRTADCLPVFLYAPDKNVIGLVHAGWKGTKSGIVRAAVKSLREHWSLDPARLKAALGPAIRACCYEVGGEFKRKFPGYLRQYNDGRFHFDLVAANKDQLAQEGVRPRNIADAGICTCCDRRFYSYRRQGQSAGRMLSLMMLRTG